MAAPAPRAMAAADSSARAKVARPDTMSPVSRLLMKLVNTSPGTSTMMPPARVTSRLMGAPSARMAQEAVPSTKADARVDKKALPPACSRQARHAPQASPASPAHQASAQP